MMSQTYDVIGMYSDGHEVVLKTYPDFSSAVKAAEFLCGYNVGSAYKIQPHEEVCITNDGSPKDV